MCPTKPAIIVLLLVIVTSSIEAQKYLNIMTFNIRLDLASDSLNAWPYRKDKVISQILFHETDILGIQEARPHQLKELMQGLPSYDYVGEPRDQSGEWTEYSAICYNKSRLTLLAHSTFWLSAHPEIKWQKGWDAALPRIVSYALFWNTTTHDSIYVFNTHFDHRGEEARKQSALLLLDKARSMAQHRPCIVMGDFNATPEEQPIQLLTKSNGEGFLTNTDHLTTHYGPIGTFNGFKNPVMEERAIDHIFVTKNIKVLQHATLTQTWNGRYSSDHFPVFARLEVID